MADEKQTYQMTMARTENYWISPDVLYLTLNAMGQPDYLQGNVSSGAVIMCYIRSIEGLSYDAGHNYRRWPLAVSPTYFNTSTEKYVYVAIPKSDAVNAYAQVVFPSEKIDIYGKNADGKQVASDQYYFIFLQGIISASIDANGATQMRTWSQRIDCGSLASDEALAAGGADSWWQYSSVDDTITFLKTITKAVFDNLTAKVASITKLILGGKPLTGIAQYPTSDANSETEVVTPKYVNDKGNQEYLSKTHDDTTEHKLTMREAEVKGNAKVGGDSSVSGNSTVGKDLNVNGDAKIAGSTTTHNLTVTGTAHFFELQVDKITAGSGGRISSAANGFSVADVGAMEGGRIKVYWLAQDSNGRAVMNMWRVNDQAICMSFNLAQLDDTGKGEAVVNKYYWCLVTGVSGMNPETRTVNGVEGKYNWIELSTQTKAEGCTVNPAVGDDIAQLGYEGTDDPNRQSAIYESSYVSLDPDMNPPFRATYRGISDFDLKSHRASYQDAKGELIVGNLKALDDRPDVLTLTQKHNGLVTQTTPDVIDISIKDGYGNDVSLWYTLSVERDSGDAQADALWNMDHKNVKFPLSISYSDLSTMGLAQSIFFTVKAVSENRGTLTASVYEKLDSTRKFYIAFSSNRRVVYDDDVDMAITAHIMYGDDDYTDKFLADNRTQFKWTRNSGVEAEDNAWKPTTGDSGNILLVEHHINSNNSRLDCGSRWTEALHVEFSLEAKVYLDSVPTGKSTSVSGTVGLGTDV